jgi:hypothetical protein
LPLEEADINLHVILQALKDLIAPVVLCVKALRLYWMMMRG